MVLNSSSALFPEKGNSEVGKIIKELTRQNDRLAIIQQIAKSINVAMSYEEIIDQVAGPLRSVLPYDLLSFCLLENNQLIIKSGVPKEQKILGMGWVLDSSRSAPWKAIAEKRCFLRQDIWNDPDKYQEDDDLRRVGIKSAIMTPLLVKNEAIGTLNFGSKKTFAYSENDFIFVQQMADQLAVCINNTRLFGEVLKTKREWEETFKAVPDNLFLIDRSHNVLRWNKQNNICLNKTLEAIKCYQLFDCCGGDLKLCPVTKVLQNGLPAACEVTNSNTMSIYNVSASPVYNEENKLYFIVIHARDVTAKTRMEEQLFQSAKLSAIGEMAAGVAHELNSPLTAIIGNSGLILKKTSRDNKYHKLLADIKTCGQRSKRIIQNLLTFSRQDSYTFEPVSINDVIAGSLSLVSYQIEKNNIQISTKLAPKLPLLMGNKQQLEQVVINFLLNARDALVSIDNGSIEVSTDLEEDPESGVPVIAARVADNGQGIPQNIIKQIFHPFFTTKEKTCGTGLGLSVSLGIAQTHGGKIKVSSEVGRGSTFTLLIPL